MNKENFKIFSLCIIESLGKDDVKTGTSLIGDLLKYKKMQEPEIHFRLQSIRTIKSLKKELIYIQNKIENDGWFVIIHFETHGSQDGMCLGSGEMILWRDLMNLLRPINILLQNMLIVHLGMCHGGWITSAIDKWQRAPLRAFIATTQSIGERDLLSAFTAFYDDFFWNFEPFEGVKKMNSAFDSSVTQFNLVRSEELFDLINPDFDPINFKRIVDYTAKHNYYNSCELQKSSFALYRSKIEENIRNEFLKLDKNRDFFTMEDIRYPK